MSRVCLVNGKHLPGSPWEKECPLNPTSYGKTRKRPRTAHEPDTQVAQGPPERSPKPRGRQAPMVHAGARKLGAGTAYRATSRA